MNAYDFDGTIYRGDSTIDFYLFCLKKKKSLIKFLFSQVLGVIRYKFGRYTKEELKESFFVFLKGIEEIDLYVNEFWDKNECKIEKWYLLQKENQDVIISASPEFLLQNLCKRLEINYLIASKVDKATGKFESKNCFGEEKPKRFFERFPQGIIDKFYSDSFSDQPMADIAKESFIVKRGLCTPWI